MKALQTIIAVATLLHAANTFAQTEEAEDATSYKAEVFGSASSGSTTPFWMVSNRYGVVPLDANNGYLNAGVFHQQHFGKGFRWSAGLDIVAVVPRYRNVYIQQIYAELGYKSMLLSVGSKENRHSLWDHSLSSGDMVLSSNARPIPEIKLSMPGIHRRSAHKGLDAGKRRFCGRQVFRYQISGRFLQWKTNLYKERPLAS